MIKALAIKELREIRIIALIALCLYLALVSNLTGGKLFMWMPFFPSNLQDIPFAGSTFTEHFAFISAAFLIALGVMQTGWEGTKGTYQFLLHRPMRREWIFLTKLATGIVVFLSVAFIPIILYAWWASIPGHDPSPFEWWMTEQAWRLWLLMPLVYLGAFLSGLRPASWGIRLLPLVACGILVAFDSFFKWWIALPLAIVMYGLLTAAICHVARVRDYA